MPCRYLHEDGDRATCRAHGFEGPTPRGPRREPQPLPARRRPLRGGGGLPERRPGAPPPARSLPVLATPPPARTPAPRHRAGPPTTPAGAPAAGTSRSRSCVPEGQRRLEALVRSRRSPYLCKIERAGDYSLEVEMISACGYLGADGVACTLHGRHRRRRPDRQARSLQRMAAQEPGPPSRLCLRPAPAPGRGTMPDCASVQGIGRLAVLHGDPARSVSRRDRPRDPEVR